LHYYNEILTVMHNVALQVQDFFRRSGFPLDCGVWRAQDPEVNADVEKLYHAIREKEGWLYPDARVAQLPLVPGSDAHAFQWKARGYSCDRLSKYLIRHYHGGSVLDLGCGNGWMSARLAGEGYSVCGLDLHYQELLQGARVFNDVPNLCFLYGNVFNDVLPEKFFNFIIMASSFQYFGDAPQLLKRLFILLRPGGEIHIVDTPFYTSAERDSAAGRSKRYYAGIGYPSFAGYYFHRTLDELSGYSYVRIGPPNRVANALRRFFRRGISPFPWIVIKKP
jgi:SAM-dependent methyltransferase